MLQAVSDRVGEPRASLDTRPLPSPDDAVVDHAQDGSSLHYTDLNQQYIMLDGGIFVRLNDASEPAEAVKKQASSSSPFPVSGTAVCRDLHAGAKEGLSPRLLIVPQHNMAVNSVSCAFSVGSRSFLVSPTCVAREASLLSFLDGNLDLSFDNDGALMLWCSWFAICPFLILFLVLN